MKRAECNSFLPILFLVPLIIWFLGWKFAHFVPTSIRPDINVSTLPKIERALFGSSLLYHVFPSHEALVIFSVPPYLIHFTLPFVFGAYLYLIGGRLMCFFICFGLLNFGAIITQFGFPTAPPWYYAKYGEEPASYDMPGDPGRFAMLDERLEMKFFDSMYKSNPVVFGAFPSLHAAWPFLIAAYFPFFAPSIHSSVNVLGQILHMILSRVRWIYVGWIWFAAVYTTHHFFIDIMGGVIYTMIAATAVKLTLGGKLGERLDHFAHDVIDNILRRLKSAALLVAGIYLTRKRVRSPELSV